MDRTITSIPVNGCSSRSGVWNASGLATVSQRRKAWFIHGPCLLFLEDTMRPCSSFLQTALLPLVSSPPRDESDPQTNQVSVSLMSLHRMFSFKVTSLGPASPITSLLSPSLTLHRHTGFLANCPFQFTCCS